MHGPNATATVAMILVIAPLAATAQTQSAARQQTRIETRQRQIDAVLETGAGSLTSNKAFAAPDGTSGGPVTYSLDLSAPLTYNSNAELNATGGTSTIEGVPDARFSWRKNFADSNLVLSGYVDGSLDRYLQSKAANEDFLIGAVRIQTRTGTDDQEYQPFVQYKSTVSFRPTFSRATSTTHEIAIGFDKAFNYELTFAGSGVFGPASHTGTATAWSLGFSGYAARDLVDSGTSYYSLSVAPSIAWIISNGQSRGGEDAQWTASFEVDITRDFYDRTQRSSESDWVLNPILTIALIPSAGWFPGDNAEGPNHAYGWFRRPSIALQLSFTRTWSNKPGTAYSQWTVGPLLTIGWEF